MRLLITGGAGFVGSHLADWLAAAGHDVTLLDDLSTGSVENVPRHRLVVGSAGDESVLAPLAARCDAIFHLAAAVGVELIAADPVRTIETNVHVTEVVLRQGKPTVFASTSEVYGKSEKVPFREEDDLVLGAPTHPRWAYACSKLVGEFLGMARGNVAIARLFNTVGPRQTGRYGMVLPRFVEQALAGGPITVYGDGEQTRSFTYVGDAVRALAALLDFPGEIVNVGSREEISIRALAERVRARLAPGAEIVHVPHRIEDMRRRAADITKAERLLGWRPVTPLDEIIDRVAGWVRARGGRS